MKKRSASQRESNEPGPFRSDDELVVQTAAGDENAFRVLVDRWSARVLVFLTRTLGSRADAEDLTQETFVRVYRAAVRYRSQGRFASWLFRIAGNLARQELRRRKVRGFWLGAPGIDETTILESIPAPPEFDPDGPLQRAETRAALALALARLPDRQRMALLLRYFESMPVRDIADALGTSERAAESLLSRALRTLRRTLHPRRVES